MSNNSALKEHSVSVISPGIEMFYSSHSLSGKGPLVTAWLAAHLQRKLLRSQINEANISKVVDAILSPTEPLALRVSAYLLLGIVRIYSRKLNYLFSDCNETLLKVKKAVLTSLATIPLQPAPVTLDPRLPNDLDLDEVDPLSDEESDGSHVDRHVALPEQITLQELFNDDNSNTGFYFEVDERFPDGSSLHVDFGYAEVLNQESAFDESQCIVAGIANEPLNMNRMKQIHANAETNMNDQFEPRTPPSMALSVHRMHRYTPVRTDEWTEKAPVNRLLAREFEKLLGNDNTLCTEALQSDPDTQANGRSENFQQHIKFTDQDDEADEACSDEMHELATSLDNERKTLTAEDISSPPSISNGIVVENPLRTPDNVRLAPRTPKRSAGKYYKYRTGKKRKSVTFDTTLVLSDKDQLANTGDLRRPRKRTCREIASTHLVACSFTKASITGLCDDLQNIYSRALTISRSKHPNTPASLDADRRTGSHLQNDVITDNDINGDLLEVGTPTLTKNDSNEVSMASGMQDGGNQPVVSDASAEQLEERESQHISQEIQNPDNDTEAQSWSEPGFEPSMDLEDEGNMEDEDINGLEWDTETMDESGRTRAMGLHLKAIFERSHSAPRRLNFEQLLARKTRREAACTFFAILVLKSKDYVHVEQAAPFDHIQIMPTTNLMDNL